MTTVREQLELKDKIIAGLEHTYKKLIEFKKKNNTELVIIKDKKIMKIKPE